MKSPYRMLFTGMAIMLLILKPQVGLAIANSVAVGMQGITEALVEQQHRKEKEPEDVVAKNDATATVLEQILNELKNLKPKEPQIIIEEHEVSQVSKEQTYKRALEDQELLESRAKYRGDDPIVRNRLDLPPKLPPFEKYNLTPDAFDKEFNSKLGIK